MRGHGRDRPSSQRDLSGCCAQGRAVVSSRQGAAGTIEAPPGHRSPQPVQPNGYLAAHPAPCMSPMLVLSPAHTGCAPLPTGSEHRQAPLCLQIARFCFPPHPKPANMVEGHQPLSTLEGWLHFVLDGKGDTWSRQDALCIPAPGWSSSPMQGTQNSLEPSPPPSLQGHGAGGSSQGCASRPVMPSGSAKRKPLIFRALVAFACRQTSKFPVSQGKAEGGGKWKAWRWH